MASEILIVNASPRAEGNSAYLSTVCGEAFDQQGKSWERIDLRRLKISPCRGCGLCRQGKIKYCVLQDDMSQLYDKVAQCRAILMVSPIYWFTYTAQLKGFIDRLYGLWNWDRNFLAGKRAGAVLVYADADPYESGAVNAIHTLEHMFRFVNADCRGFAYGTAGGPGSAANNPELLERTRKLALGLA